MKLLICLLCVVELVGCTKRNPDVCCETAEECAEIGTAEISACEVGVCVGHVCVDRGECDGNEDCESPATCQVGACVLSDGPMPGACVTDPIAQCRQILAHHCALVSRCNPGDPVPAMSCQENVDAVCGSNPKVLTEQNCQGCRTTFDQGTCSGGDEPTESCLACYGLATSGADCPN